MQPKWLFVQRKTRTPYKKWTDGGITETLKLLHTHSLKDIAARLGVSPASISKALRRRNISVCCTQTAIRQAANKPIRTKRNLSQLAYSNCDAAVRAITHLSVHRCKWPIGDTDSPDFHFCNARRIKGDYCATHDAIAYQREAA